MSTTWAEANVTWSEANTTWAEGTFGEPFVRPIVLDQETGDLVQLGDNDSLLIGGRELVINVLTDDQADISYQLKNDLPNGNFTLYEAKIQLSKTEITNSERIFLNGLKLVRGLGNDYTIKNGLVTLSTQVLIYKYDVIEILYR